MYLTSSQEAFSPDTGFDSLTSRVGTEDRVFGQLLADVEKAGTRAIAETVIHSDEALRATGFTLDSPIFEGCWSAFEPKTIYCFPSDRHFSYTSNDPEFGTYKAYGLWRLENGRVIVDRYRIPGGMLLEVCLRPIKREAEKEE